MGVPREVFKAADPALSVVGRTFKLREVIRHPAGDWTILYDATMTAKLDDGRTVHFAGEVRLKGHQTGRVGRARKPGQLAAWLKGERTRRGLTLRDVEAATGISNPMLSQIENGHVKEPGVKTLRALAALYGTTLDALSNMLE